jgi:parallel beta-helix repeat protein
MNSKIPGILVAAISCLFVIESSALAQGSLTPTGAPAPTMKSLAQIEPRTPISSLPTNITVSGSYYLTTNLIGTASGGITISADGVTVDLNGFALVGGTGPGVLVSGIRTNVAIRNGTINGWTSFGVDASLAFNCQYQDLRLSLNGGAGLFAGTNSTVINCSAQSNGGTGIATWNGCTISGCTAQGNGTAGFATGIVGLDGSTISGCTSRNNTANGITTGEGCTVSGCTVFGNGGKGITPGFGSTVNDCTARLNQSDGIQVVAACHVFNNTCNNNVAAGINATADGNWIDNNLVTGNARGIACNPATGNLITRNSARANSPNYDIIAGNNSGAIIATPGVAFTNSNAWANFGF